MKSKKGALRARQKALRVKARQRLAKTGTEPKLERKESIKKRKVWTEFSEKVPKHMTVRLNEVDQAKLDYILANSTHKSKHLFCISAIRRAINRALKQID